MAFKDIDDFQAVFEVAEKDDLVLEGSAADVRGKFAAGDAHLEGERGKVIAMRA